MAEWETIGDDGWETIDAPKKPTREELIRQYQLEDAASMSGMESFLVGAGKKTNDLVEGVKSLYQGDEYQGNPYEAGSGYDALKDTHGFATGAGEFASELGQLAIPGGAALKGMKAANVLKGSPILAATLADVLGSGGAAATRLPGEGETRGKNAGFEGLMSLIGGGVTKGLTGAAKTDSAKLLEELGVYLTPGQAAESKGIQAIENVMDVTPFAARGTQGAKARGQQEFRNLLDTTVGKEVGVDTAAATTGTEAYKLMDDAFIKGYKEAFSTLDEIPEETFPSILKAIGDASKDLSLNLNPIEIKQLKAAAAQVRKFKKEAARVGTETMPASSPAELADKFDRYLRRQIRDSGGQVGEAFTKLKTAFHNSLPPEIAAKMKHLDTNFPNKLVIEDATKKAAASGRQGGFSPQELLRSSAKVGGGRSTARGEAPLFDLADAGVQTVGRKEGGQPLEWFRRLAPGFSSPPGMQLAGDILMGSTAGHKAVKDLPDFLLEILNPSKIVPASTDKKREEEKLSLMR